jgi:tetrapyrrole methylase family protein/MazG family protein
LKWIGKWEVDVARTITIVGLGPGDPNQITRQAWETLRTEETIYLRTIEHPLVATLPKEIQIEAFDHIYEENDDFETVYATIVDHLFQKLEQYGRIVYAVPGDPQVGEATVSTIRERAEAQGVQVDIVPGISFIEPVLHSMQWDALDGVYVVDAIEVATAYHPPFHPDGLVIIAQLYSSLLAANVKLTLMNLYPDDHPVSLVHHAGSAREHVEQIALYEIDRSDQITNMTTLVVPPMKTSSSFEAFQNTIAHLRSPEGCPWDQEQTHASLRTHLLEECYEVLHAIDNGNMEALMEELGDLTLQIVLQAQIATESNDFRMDEVLANINDKLIRRHPHVFGELELDGVDQVLHNWESLKASEREVGGVDEGALEGVPLGLPALSQANEIQDRAARVGFDWPVIKGVLDKIAEEVGEIHEALTPERKSEEIGDLFFALVNYARWLKIDPESTLRQANQRFRVRFSKMEDLAKQEGLSFSTMEIDAMETLWRRAKG